IGANPGATCDPISTLTWVCAIPNHGSSSPLGFTLAPFLRPPRRGLDPGWISFPRSNRTFSKRGERGDLVPTEAVGLLPRAPNPSAAACRKRPILPGSMVTVLRLKGSVGDRSAGDSDRLASQGISSCSGNVSVGLADNDAL